MKKELKGTIPTRADGELLAKNVAAELYSGRVDPAKVFRDYASCHPLTTITATHQIERCSFIG